MKDLLLIACGAGLHDGLNPCIFITCAVFIVHGLWLKARSMRIGFLRIAFVLVYVLGILAFDFGPGQALVFKDYFVFAAKILYFVLGVWAFVVGVSFFKDWIMLRRGIPVDEPKSEKIKFLSVTGLIACLLTIILPLVLSALATYWPVDKYIILLGNIGIARGQWRSVMPLLVGYAFFSMWPIWFVWSFIGIKGLRPSLLKIVCASIFFTASSSVILIFK